MTTIYYFDAAFTKSKIGFAPSSAPVVDLLNTATGTLVVTGGPATAYGVMAGVYSYAYSGADGLRLIGLFRTTDTSGDGAHIWSYTPVQIAVAPPTAAANADAVWDELLAGHTVVGSSGAALASAGSAADPLLNTVPGSYPSNSAGYALGRLSSTNLTVVQPTLDDGFMRIIRGDDYNASDGRSFDITDATWPTLTGGTVVWTIAGVAHAGSVSDVHTARLELTKVQSMALVAGQQTYTVVATLATTARVVTLVKNAAVLIE